MEKRRQARGRIQVRRGLDLSSQQQRGQEEDEQECAEEEGVPCATLRPESHRHPRGGEV